MITNKSLKELSKKYKKKEEESFVYKYKNTHHLAIRLDGVRFTSKYARKEFVPHYMNKLIAYSLLETYKRLYSKHTEPFCNFICGIIQVNDEVTFILNTGKNKYENRILKILSIVNGMMSSWSTNYVLNNKRNFSTVSTKIEYFDARPILLKDIDEIVEYTKYRYFIAKKHALAKTLKFTNFKLNNKMWENFSECNQLVSDNDLYKKTEEIIDTFYLYCPSDFYDLKSFNLSDSFILNELHLTIDASVTQRCQLNSNLPPVKEIEIL